MNHRSGAILGRIVTVVVTLLLAGLAIRLVVAMLGPVLPANLLQAIGAGWDFLMSLIGPALAPIFAAIFVGVGVWVFIGRRH